MFYIYYNFIKDKQAFITIKLSLIFKNLIIILTELFLVLIIRLRLL